MRKTQDRTSSNDIQTSIRKEQKIKSYNTEFLKTWPLRHCNTVIMYYLRICHEWNLATRRYEDVERLGSVWEILTDVLWMNDVKFTKEVRIKHAMHVQIYKKKNWPIRQSLTVPWPTLELGCTEVSASHSVMRSSCSPSRET